MTKLLVVLVGTLLGMALSSGIHAAQTCKVQLVDRHNGTERDCDGDSVVYGGEKGQGLTIVPHCAQVVVICE